MISKKGKGLIFAGLAVFMVSLIYTQVISKEEKSNKKENKLVVVEDSKVFQDINNLSTWIVYWDLNSDKEIKALGKGLKNLSYFGVNFDSNNELIMPENLLQYYDKRKNDDYNKYITIVNDKIHKDGSSSLKDTDLLRALLSNSERRSKHIEDILALAMKHNFNGIEIDYEQMKQDINLWENYILFADELYKRTEKEGLKLRIVLEPNIPFDKLTFHEGPTYVIMCYNLHGGFSEPGEKANPEFIKETIEKGKNVPGNKEFAIPTGGFNWASNGKTTSITEIEANRIANEYKASIKRHEESQSLFFKYVDDEDIEHEIWYGDKTTLEAWMKVIKEAGYQVSLWRLGGNSLE